MANILVANAHLVGLWLQMLATGAYFVILPQCIVILRRKLRQGLSIWLPAAAAVMFVSTIIDLVVEMIRGFHAFAIHGTALPNPSAFYANAAAPESLVKNALNVIVAVISDMIMVYRTFVIWNMNLAIVLIPSGLILANIAIGIWAMWTLSQTRVGDVLILADVTVRIRYFFVLTFCVNMICASLICLKIWRVHALAKRVSDASATKNVLEIVIESAALYCAYLFILIVTSSVGSNVFFIFLDPLPPVTAVVFSMLIVRAQTGVSRGGGGPAATAQTSTIRFGSRSFGPGVSTTARNTTTTRDYTAGGVELDLACVAERHGEEGESVGDSVSRIGYAMHASGEMSRDKDLDKV
ncbi:hypothetical protein GY45DRAFT_1368869 [Cubamyces sp. BRFM 1775]|nr:hypothetical protein GY45DRAFT_1368869 [Cubamyces sp. BRFM 1775]